MDADPTTGMLVGQTQTYPDGSVRYGEYRIGGTSLASPLFAGMTALKLQHEGHGLGMLNPVIYSNQTQFTDVRNAPGDIANVRVDYVNSVDGSDGLVYSVRTFGQDTTLKATVGWDNDTGVGEPNLTWFKRVVVP
jgi:subtilase family serine protease